jgi:hypothetical protein
MPVPRHASPAAPATGELSKLLYCSHCDGMQPVAINAIYPALYCGKDVIHFHCVTCGTDGTETVADCGALPRPTEPAPPRHCDIERSPR